MIHEQIKERRKAQKLSQAQLADRVGITRLHMGRIERGESISIDRLNQIAAALGCTLEINLKCK